MQYEQLAKLTPPRLGKVYLRTRLFQQLDVARQQHPVIWISAPAGAGKTTLITSYLQDRKLKPLWYQVDEGDSDPASFYYYLGIAGQAINVRQKTPLPLFTPEYQAGMSVFTRNFFRELMLRLPKQGVIVFDNVQDVGQSEQFIEQLLPGLAEIPDGKHIVFISRETPARTLGRMQLNHALHHIDWSQLSFTLEESRDYLSWLQLGSPVNEKVLQTIHTQVNGWVVGMRLLHEKYQFEHNPALTETAQDNQVLFDFFATELFEKLPSKSQQCLLKTSVFPRIRVDAAVELTGDPNVNALLVDMTRRNYFTVQHTSEPITYEYHPMFRAFLYNRARQELPAEQFKKLRLSAAAMLIEQQDINAAFEIYQDMQETGKLVDLCLNHAESLISQGRFQTLQHWIQAIPPALKTRQPWINYWLGMSNLAVQPVQAITEFKQAYALAKTADDSLLQVLSWCGAVYAYTYAWGEFVTLDAWIADLERIRTLTESINKKEIQEQFIFAAFLALMYRQPHHTRMPEYEAKVWDIVMHGKDMQMRMQAAGQLLIYFTWFRGEFEKARQIVETIQPFMDKPESPALVKLIWHTMASGFFASSYIKDQAAENIQKALQLAKETGVYIWNPLIFIDAIILHVHIGKTEQATAYLEQLNQTRHPDRVLLNAVYFFQKAWYEFQDGPTDAARENILIARQYALEAGNPFFISAIEIHFAHIELLTGDKEMAQELLQKHREYNLKINARNLVTLTSYAQIHDAIVNNDLATCTDLVISATSYFMPAGLSFWLDEVMSIWCGIALRHQIKMDEVKSVIRKHDLTAPEGIFASDNWPFPIKLYTLGRFSLLLENEKQDLSSKSQARPLDLFKCLIALGGRNIAQEKVSEALWPEIDGDTSNNSIHTTLYRLRKLIRQDEAIILRDGLLSLDSRYVWVDAWALERTLTELEQACKQTENTSAVEQLAQRIWRYYNGPFLHLDKDPLWATTYRDRLQMRVQRTLLLLGTYWQTYALTDKAIDTYERLLELDRLHEPAYQQLMQLYIAQNRYAEAAATYERCRKVLSTGLGVMPSAQTLQLYQRIEME